MKIRQISFKFDREIVDTYEDDEIMRPLFFVSSWVDFVLLEHKIEDIFQLLMVIIGTLVTPIFFMLDVLSFPFKILWLFKFD